MKMDDQVINNIANETLLEEIKIIENLDALFEENKKQLSYFLNM